MTAGDTVRIKKGHENCLEELSMRFVIVEAFGDRALIQPLEWAGYLTPTELVPMASIEKEDG